MKEELKPERKTWGEIIRRRSQGLMGRPGSRLVVHARKYCSGQRAAIDHPVVTLYYCCTRTRARAHTQ